MHGGLIAHVLSHGANFSMHGGLAILAIDGMQRDANPNGKSPPGHAFGDAKDDLLGIIGINDVSFHQLNKFAIAKSIIGGCAVRPHHGSRGDQFVFALAVFEFPGGGRREGPLGFGIVGVSANGFPFGNDGRTGVE